MRKLQTAVNNWQDETFGSHQTTQGLINHLKEEVEELENELAFVDSACNILGIGKGAPEDENFPYSLENIQNELADIIILSCGLARLFNIDLEKSVADKMAINKEREWDDEDDLGIIRHI